MQALVHAVTEKPASFALEVLKRSAGAGRGPRYLKPQAVLPAEPGIRAHPLRRRSVLSEATLLRDR